ncbi:hypothetical protein GCM10010517_15930 [Streptosporangium fragile]|uniref:Ricin B lectin domain-containing protein n=1 Tax=Streptosporangium fragile TaxID=46186 RepID=A0ABN3VTH1_9ACTN
MSNGFPDGEFCIVNEETGLYLACLPGGTIYGEQQGVDRLTGETEGIGYSHTNDQVLGLLEEPSGKKFERWFLDDRKNSRGLEFYHLVNCAKDIRSWYTLWAVLPAHKSSPYADIPGTIAKVSVQGRGQSGQTQWRAEDGMFFPGDPAKVVTLAKTGLSGYEVIVADRGAPRQKWRFVTDS